MSVTSQIPYKSYTAAPGATLFSCGFKLLLATDLEVTVDSVVTTNGFTVSGIGAATADVTFGTPMVGGEIVELQRKVPQTRSTDYQQLGDYQAAQVNFDFDRLVMMLQDAKFLNDLAVLLPVGDAAAPMTLPALADRASKFLAFDALGAAIAAAGTTETPVSSYMATVLLAINATAALAALNAQVAGVSAAKGANSDITSLGALAVVPTIVQTAINSKKLVQTQTFSTGTYASGINPIPADNSIPQITEGDQYMSLTFTPTNAASTLEISVTFNAAIASGSYTIAALFVVGTSNALKSVFTAIAANSGANLSMFHSQVAGTTSPLTFTVRGGAAAAATMYFNGASGSPFFGGTIASQITIKEYLP
jgi:hypothetical protein